MGFIKYETEAAYTNAGKPTDVSRVALVEETNDAKIDGVNVITEEPTVGDVVFHDGTNVIYVKGGSQLVKSLIPSGWTHVGYVYGRRGRQVMVVNKTGSDVKYADVLQFKVTVPSESGTLTLGARFVSVSSNTTISVEYTAGMDLATAKNTYEANETTLCGLINTALANLEGITGDWWAYLNDNDEVILQRDTWTDYRQYICSGALTFVTWGDMPAITVYFKNNGKYTEYRGLMNIARGVAYWSTNGRTPSATESLGAAGNTDPVSSDAFTNSEYCSELRAAYSSYKEYLYGEYGVKCPQKYGTFAIDGIEVSNTYALLTAPTKSGGTKYKFPAMSTCALVDYGVTGIALGSWRLPTSEEGCYLLDDDNLALVAASISKMDTTAINNSTIRWFVERCNVYGARSFSGTSGYLSTGHVSGGIRAQGVTLLDL